MHVPGVSYHMHPAGQHGTRFQAFSNYCRQSEQWSEAATISAAAAKLSGEEEEEQPDAASHAEPLPEVAM